MNTLIILVVSILTFSVLVCAILAKVLSVLTIIGAVCWLLNLFSVTGTTVLWLFVGTIACGLYIFILPILISIIAEFGGNNGADN